MRRSLRYEAVVFDLDGTLVDSYAALEDAVNHSLREHEHAPLAPGRIRDFVGEGVERLMQRAFAQENVPQSAYDAFVGRYDQVCCSGSTPLEGVEATLRALTALGLPMGVCTNKPTSFSRKILAFLQLAHHFSAIVGPDVAGSRKPDGRHVTATLEAIGADARTTLFVGDMPIDVLAARNGGTAVATIATGSSTREELLAAQPDHMLESFSDLVRLIGSEAA